MGWFSRPVDLIDQTTRLQPQVEAWVDRSNLEEVAFYDITGEYLRIMSRAAGMRVPAVARARHLTCGAIAKAPLVAYRADVAVAPQPYWAYGTDGQLGDLSATEAQRLGLTAQSPWYRMLWTVDDHIFYGSSLWYSTALAPAVNDDDRRRPARIARIPWDYWAFEDGAFVDQDGRPLDQARCILIPGPHEGILRFGERTIRIAADLESGAADVAQRPFRLELHQTSGAELSREERRETIAEARTALAANDGVLFTNQAIETKDHPLTSEQLLVEARNASAVDIARLVSTPASLIDAANAGSSMDYSNLDHRNQLWLDFSLALYMDAITARLGMDDVLPAGQRAAFDTTELTATPAAATGYPTED
ncbi:hypothetical protein [Cellulomonas sp. URHB0016]